MRRRERGREGVREGGGREHAGCMGEVKSVYVYLFLFNQKCLLSQLIHSLLGFSIIVLDERQLAFKGHLLLLLLLDSNTVIKLM